MTLLICPVRPGMNEELRYALRSWETNLVLPRLDLMIVGDKPDWLHPDEFVSGNNHDSAQANVFDNVYLGAAAAVLNEEREAIVMNDDFFCMDPVPGVLPVRRNLRLTEHANLYPQYRHSWWARSLDLTASWLTERGFPRPWSYEVHRPLLCAPAALLWALSKWDGGLEGDIPQWRSMYGVLNRVEAHPVGDVKIGYPTMDKYTGWISTHDGVWPQYAPLMAERFPRRSRWER